VHASPAALLVAALALVVALYAAVAPVLSSASEEAPSPAPEGPAPEAHAASEADLLGTMIRSQRYLEKAAAAGEAGNWPLAAFYAHELEETAEHVATAGWVDDGVELGPLAARWAVPAAERLHEAAVAGDDVACHRATDHGFLQIAVPSAPGGLYPSQRFSPEAAP
jgi:hypothetical protein